MVKGIKPYKVFGNGILWFLNQTTQRGQKYQKKNCPDPRVKGFAERIFSGLKTEWKRDKKNIQK